MPSALFITTVDITLEAFLLPFAEHLRAMGWRIDALANGAASNGHIADSFDARHEIGWTRSPLSSGSRESAGRVREVVSAGGYDLVWVHTPVAAMITRFALRHRPPRHPAIVYTAHGFHFVRGGQAIPNAVYRAIERGAARWTDYIVTINDEDYAAARAFGTIDPDRIRLVRGIGVDTDRLAPDVVPNDGAIRHELAVPNDAVLVTMVAEFTANKRHTLALDALERVKTPGVVLALVGSGPLEGAIRAEVERRGLGERVRFAGYRRDLPAVLAASDALLLCSAREGLNRSGLEAMALAVPVIGTPTRGIADLIGDDEAGWVSASHSPQDLAAAVDAAAADARERARRGAAARERAVREFDLTRVIAAYDALFAEALALRDGTR